MLTNIEAAALVKAATMPKDLPVGEHHIDMLVRIFGTITKGKDYDSAVYQPIPFDQLFAIAMSKLNGVTIESIVREALDSDDIDASGVKDSVKEAIAALTDKAVKTCSGKTTAKISAEVVEALVAV